MTQARTASVVAVVLIDFLALSGLCVEAAGQDALIRAKDLYTSAAYDEALAVLTENRVTAAEKVEADEYRAFCLLALGKLDDATKVIEQIFATHPSFQPTDAQASPRVREAFRSVRRRMLPTIARKAYTDARDAYNRSNFDVAAKEFDRVVALLGDSDIADSGDLADLRLLSKGFGELIAKTTPSAAAAPPTERAATGGLQPLAAPSTGTWNPDQVYGASDLDVAPPITISQAVPPWHPRGQQQKTHELTAIILIDEAGTVAAVRLLGSLNSPYDDLFRQAASRWKYRPAMKDGRPVKFQKVVAIRLEPAGSSR